MLLETSSPILPILTERDRASVPIPNNLHIQNPLTLTQILDWVGSTNGSLVLIPFICVTSMKSNHRVINIQAENHEFVCLAPFDVNASV